MVVEEFVSGGREPVAIRPSNLTDWRDAATSLDIGAYSWWTSVLKVGGQWNRVSAVLMDAEAYGVIGVQPKFGRVPEKPGEVLASQPLCERMGRSAFDCISLALPTSDSVLTVVGVAAADFRFPYPLERWQAELWAYADPVSLSAGGRKGHTVSSIARLRPGFTLDQARAEMTGLARLLAEEHPVANRGWTVVVTPASLYGIRRIRGPLGLFAAASLAMLALACVTAAARLLANFPAREREVGIRLALGASRGAIVRQLLQESVYAAVAALALACLAAPALMRVVLGGMPETIFFPGLEAARVGTRSTGIVGMFLVSASGLAGWLLLRRILRDPSRSLWYRGGGMRTLPARRVLSAAQVALATVLLVLFFQFHQAVLAATSLDPAIQAEGVHLASILLPAERYPEREDSVVILKRI
jgi:hypothetical protein